MLDGKPGKGSRDRRCGTFQFKAPVSAVLSTQIFTTLKVQLDTLKEFCITHDLTIATAESVTAAHLRYILSLVPGAAQFFQGGIAAYLKNITMQKSNKKKAVRPAQAQQRQPGLEEKMKPAPDFAAKVSPFTGRLHNKVALITGGDSGIGRAVAVAFAAEGADVIIAYLDEHEDAALTARHVQEHGRKVLLIPGDVSNEKHCIKIVTKAVKEFKRIDVLVNNAAVQFPQKGIEDISAVQLQKTFATNIFSQFYLTKAALPYMAKGSSIINTTSVTAYRGSSHLLDYSATKGAIVAFTRSLSASLTEKGIRVNAVAPGPIWTPLIPATFTPKEVAQFGSDVPMKRAGQPAEVAPSYVFLASEEASYITGQILHPNGGEIVNG